MADVLISSTAADRAAAEACAQYLASAGFDVAIGQAPESQSAEAGDGLRSEAAAARAIVVLWSPTSIRSAGVLETAAEAAATGRLIAIRTPDLSPRLIPSEFRGFVSGPATDTQRIAQSLVAIGVAPQSQRANGPIDPAVPAADMAELERQAFTFANHRGEPRLLRMFIDRFRGSELEATARKRIADIEETESPDENARRPMRTIAAVAVGVALLLALGLSQLRERKPVEISIATGDEDGAYKRLVESYNDYLKQYGVTLVPHPDANGGFENVRLLAEGQVNAAFVKGGFAGALNDPEYLNKDRIASRGKAWDRDWQAKLSSFGSLGRVMLEPLWVFTYGSSESNRLNELDGEPINLGTMTGGTRTLAALLLEANKVRFKQGMWREETMPMPKEGAQKPLGVARAYFLQRQAESPRVAAFLRNLAPEHAFDKSKDIRVATFSPDGKTIALAMADSKVRLWDAMSGHPIRTLEGHTDRVNDIAFDAAGKRIATGADDGTVKIWDVATGQELKSFAGTSGEDINGVAFSPDGTRVLSASESDRAVIRDIASGTIVSRFIGHEDDLTSAIFSPDGKVVATTSRDGTARLWDAASGTVLRVLRGHTKAVQAASFSPDGKLLATASWDNTARIWEVATGDLELILQGHEDLVRGVEFSHDGKRLITASWDDSARIWDAATGQQLRKINGLRSNVNGVGFSPDDTIAMTASQDGVIRLWDTKTWAKVNDFTTRDEEAGGSHGVTRNLHLLNFEKEADAYISRYPFLSKIVLPRGAVQFEPDVPSESITLLATSVAIVVDKTWADKHKSLVSVLTDAIVHRPISGLDEVTRKPKLFYKPGQFPTISDPEYDSSLIAAPIYRTGEVPFLLTRIARQSRFIPFGVAAWVDENASWVVLWLIPLLGIIYPLIRAIPMIYNWTVRRRILYWYRRLNVLERRLDQEDRAANPSLASPEIDKIDSAVSKIKVPLHYSDQYYDLRAHIELVRQRLTARQTTGNGRVDVRT